MNEHERADVVIIGGGPAGLEAALVLSRTRKKTVVFDAKTPPRNAASHGVHNYLGLEGKSPAAVREIGWTEIRSYEGASLRRETVVDVVRADGGFLVKGEDGSRVIAGKILLAFGFRDVLPDIPGLRECWGNTVFSCPFCDGYENRDRVWGIGGHRPEKQLMDMVHMSKNWTQRVMIFPDGQVLAPENRALLERKRVPVHEGRITRFEHREGKLHAVTLDSGARIEVGTMLWAPEVKPVPLLERLVAQLGLRIDEKGYLPTDDKKSTNIPGIWAAGDVQGWAGALGAAQAGQMAAAMMVHDWYREEAPSP